jgi:predicted RNase H-like nuclease (RuvC/YqgF family)
MKKHNPELDKLESENRKLRTQLNNSKKEIKRLKSELKSYDAAWKETDVFLKNVMDGRPLKEVIRDVNDGKGLKKLETECNRCKSPNLNILKYSNFRIAVCLECKHKEKIDEKYDSEQE